MIASALPKDIEEDRVAAMSAAMLSLGERTADELARGELSEVYVKGVDGYIVLMAAGEDAVLTAMARKDAKLGLVFLDMKRTAEAIAQIV
ncbi:MAG: roadblock/LC7 domain-containing protein [Theionarchaea archaeon]|nr:roadblock/LC7 domain-containing protein [Theionarchaea archaeon]